MDTDDYLKKVLQSQRLADDSDEMKELREHRDDVETILRQNFSESSLTIRYGGSKAKGTLIREFFDLDLVSYFATGDNTAGETLEEIYGNVKDVLSESYYVEEKTSALRLKSKDPKHFGVDFRIDVVPGRFTDDTKTDCYLFQKSGDKGRLKTNLDVHIAHIRDSGVLDAIALLKLLRARKALSVKQFAWELLGVKLLSSKKKVSLSMQLEHVLTEISNADDAITIEDPANPSGNDLMPLLKGRWAELQWAATSTLNVVEQSGWEKVFGNIESTDKASRATILTSAAYATSARTQPWSI
jgi:hypothetical protein